MPFIQLKPPFSGSDPVKRKESNQQSPVNWDIQDPIRKKNWNSKNQLPILKEMVQAASSSSSSLEVSKNSSSNLATCLRQSRGRVQLDLFPFSKTEEKPFAAWTKQLPSCHGPHPSCSSWECRNSIAVLHMPWISCWDSSVAATDSKPGPIAVQGTQPCKMV